MMKGKIKPKEKEAEPEMPTLRKRSVAKDKVIDKINKSYKIKSLIFRIDVIITNSNVGGGEKARGKTEG